jgi:hypothetical protein
MKLRSTLVLGVALLVLAGGYWLMIRSENAAREQGRVERQLFDFAPEEIQSITIARVDEDPVTAKRPRDGGWAISEPGPIDANQELWDRLTRFIAGLSNERIIDKAPRDLAAFGLSEPVLDVTAVLYKGGTTRILVGKADPLQKSRYAKLAERDEIFLISGETFYELDRKLELLRDARLFPISKDAVIERIQCAPVRDLSGEAVEKVEYEPVLVYQTGQGVWRLVEPADALADQDKVVRFANELAAARGTSFIDNPESLDDYGLHVPQARVSIHLRAFEEPLAVLFGDSVGDAQGGVYAMREGRPTVFVVDGAILSSFPRTPSDFREKRLLTHPLSTVRSLRYTGRSGSFTLEQGPNKTWTLAGLQMGNTDQQAISNYLFFLRELRAHEFVDQEQGVDYGFDEPEIRLAMQIEGEDEPLEIRIGAPKPDGSAYYAKQDTGAVALIAPIAVQGLAKSAYSFQDKTLMAFDKARALTVRLLFEGVEYVFEQGRTKWLVVQPEKKTWDSQTDMEALLAALNPVKAVDRVSEELPQDLASYGLTSPVLSVEVDLDANSEQPETVGPLKLGAVCESNQHARYAIVAGQPALFLVKQALVDTVRDALAGVRDK